MSQTPDKPFNFWQVFYYENVNGRYATTNMRSFLSDPKRRAELRQQIEIKDGTFEFIPNLEIDGVNMDKYSSTDDKKNRKKMPNPFIVQEKKKGRGRKSGIANTSSIYEILALTDEMFNAKEEKKNAKKDAKKTQAGKSKGGTKKNPKKRSHNSKILLKELKDNPSNFSGPNLFPDQAPRESKSDAVSLRVASPSRPERKTGMTSQ